MSDASQGGPQGLPPELVIDGAVAVITLRRPEVANRLEPEDLAVLKAELIKRVR